jgi:CRP-like cAMP-binding protein
MRSGGAGTSVRVLEEDPDLAAGLEARGVAAATKALVAPRAALEWESQGHGWGPPDAQGHLGLLVVEGLLLREVRLLDTYSAELLAHGDLLRPWDIDGEFGLPVPAEVCWTALEPTAVAVLDADFVRRAAAWPRVIANLAGRAVIRAKSMALNNAVTNLKQVQVRLLVLFFHLAERWGRVGVGVINVPLPLTHETLAKLVGAARPSVTTALGALAERGLLCRDDGTWRLARSATQVLASMSPREGAPL